jgi:carbon-monoxide dehydrogenase large subunit
MVASIVMRGPEASLRVVSPDVGGGFGTKTSAYPEDALVVWAARECGRPVRWTCARGDALATDYAGRDHQATGELALDADGRVLALRLASRHSLGAYFISAGASPARTTLRLSPSVYKIPVVCGEARAVFAHTAPVGVYRGAGRPEANLLIERLLDRAALACGLDAAEIRRRNLPAADEMPHTTATGACYDSGDFPAVLNACLAGVDWNGFAARQAEAERRGKRLGRAVAPYIEFGGVGNERMEIRVDAEARATIVSGTHSHGQGHATAWAQIVADKLAMPLESIDFVQGDTDRVSFGRGTYAGRSSLVGGCALALAADALLEKARKAAAFLLQGKPDAVEFRDGVFSLAGANASVSWREIAAACHSFAPPPGAELGLDGVGVHGANPPNYPNGCHACEVEVDPETGEARLTRYVAVDDVGTIFNPMICEGQVHGALAQGIGAALMESVVYDGDGQLLSGSFMDYAMPRAGDFPRFDVSFECRPSTTNILGVKGVGETGIVGSATAVVNAILDALRPLDVADIAMPATPQRVHRAIAAARRAKGVTTP